MRESEVEGLIKKPKKQVNCHWLAHVYFPHKCMEKGISTLSHNYMALSGHLAKFRKSGIEIEDLQMMIDIFAERHKDWCKGKTAWKVFVARVDTLLDEMVVKKNNIQIEKDRKSDKPAIIIVPNKTTEYDIRLAEAVRKLKEKENVD